MLEGWKRKGILKYQYIQKLAMMPGAEVSEILLLWEAGTPRGLARTRARRGCGLTAESGAGRPGCG